MGTWVVRISGDADGNDAGPRLAVKDCIDVAGLPTTAGCPGVAEMAPRAHTDAPVGAGPPARAARGLSARPASPSCAGRRAGSTTGRARRSTRATQGGYPAVPQAG